MEDNVSHIFQIFRWWRRDIWNPLSTRNPIIGRTELSSLLSGLERDHPSFKILKLADLNLVLNHGLPKPFISSSKDWELDTALKTRLNLEPLDYAPFLHWKGTLSTHQMSFSPSRRSYSFTYMTFVSNIHSTLLQDQAILSSILI